MKKLFLLSSAFIFFNCSPTYPTSIYKNNLQETENQLFHARTGETIATHLDGFYKPGIIITKGSTGTGTQNGVIKGEKFVHYMSKNGRDIYYPLASIKKGKFGSDANYSISVDPKSGVAYFRIIDPAGWRSIKFVNPIEYSKTEMPDNRKDFSQKELKFTGQAGSVLRFAYLEYTNDVSIPAYQTETQFDISNGNLFEFKGLKIQIASADNSHIDYKILSDFTN